MALAARMLEAAERFAERVAVADRDERITYKELYERALKMAGAIVTEKPEPVAVLAQRSARTVIYFLAIMLSGNYYVPIDPEAPETKKKMIAEDCGAKLLLCDRGDVHHTHFFTGTVLSEDAAADEPIAVGELPEELYVVYTSGSTGKPKGVLKGKSACEAFVDSFLSAYRITENDVFGSQTPFFFDASAKDIYLALMTGARIEILPVTLFTMPPMLIEYMNEKNITVIFWVPSALAIVARMNPFMIVRPEKLRKVFFVGEVMQAKYLRVWMQNLENASFVNLYGQSEVAGVCCSYDVNRIPDPMDVLPIGKPLPSCGVELADGEMYITGPTLSMGYYHDEERTKECFVTRDFGKGPVSAFKTGDLAKLDENGNYVFVSRSDSQIKHMGHRIELGEIEHAAMSCEGVDRCCALYDNNRQKIVLFYEGPIEDKPLRQYLKDNLQSYMVPTKYMHMEKLPLNANGKTDRPALKAMI